MKSTTNVFSKGLVTDLHPLVTDNTQLTDALNATFITHNGNEFILQNDMGNTLIQDSTTGSIMGLKDGFIPVGLKEHGGILYVASYNPSTKEGEIGSIPSPVFNYTFESLPKSNYYDNGIALYNIPDAEHEFISVQDFCSNQFIPIANTVLSVGDFFFLNLNIVTKEESIFSQKVIENVVTVRYDDVNGDAITGGNQLSFYLFNPVISDEQVGPGLFDIQLYARSSQSSSYIPITATSPCLLTPEDQNKYWFRLNEGNKYINTVKYQAQNVFQSYPNIHAGCLFVQVKLRDIYSEFSFIMNEETQLNSPYYFYEYEQ